MKPFACDQCGSTVYFDNQHCLACGCRLAFLPDRLAVCSIQPSGDAWVATRPDAEGHTYRLCFNDQVHGACNWAIDAKEPHTHCMSCRMTTLIPSLDNPQGWSLWQRAESAKRRLLFNLTTLGLAWMDGQTRQPLRFAFAQALPGGPPIITGHEHGLITLNVLEVDEHYRLATRELFSERYRTVLGHLRHEVGHYYWDELVSGQPAQLEAYRALFGDERADYRAALQTHAQAPRTDWCQTHISAYASAHPWEDWAESWAHYMHIRAAIETADALTGTSTDTHVFDALMTRWECLSTALNELNRSLGQDDAYPFSIHGVVREKVRFVHDTILGTAH
jgi:hypothetical protein